MSDIELKLRCVIFREEDLFVARCLDIEVASDGHTKAEAAANLQEAIAVYFDDQRMSFLLEFEQDIDQGE